MIDGMKTYIKNMATKHRDASASFDTPSHSSSGEVPFFTTIPDIVTT
jgi:hypothetical protein